MKKSALPLLGLLVVICLSAAGAKAAPAQNLPEAKQQAVSQLATMAARVDQFHQAARATLLDSMALPVFADYFKLVESQNIRRDSLGGLILTPEQNSIRKRMEEWSHHLHNRFPIGEICVVDRQGQEHMRFAKGQVETPSHFSDAEHGSPFFKPSFDLNKGEVHLSVPYMSADLYHWVVAFTSPIVLDNGEKPGFLHFEVPLAFYQTLIATRDANFTNANQKNPDLEEEGRYFIITRDGLVLADSRQHITLELKAEYHPEKNPNLPDYLPPERLESYLAKWSSISSDPTFLQTLASLPEQEQGVIDLALNGVAYVLAFRQIPDRPWLLLHLDPIAARGFWEK